MADDRKANLIDGLNKDLEGEYQAIIMYNTYASSVVGLYRKEVESFFRAEVPDELAHAKFLADKIASLGGTPSTRSADVARAANVRDMLENAKTAEAETIDRYIERRKQAEEYGDIALVNDLEELISDETRHKEDCEKMLRGKWEG